MTSSMVSLDTSKDDGASADDGGGVPKLTVVPPAMSITRQWQSVGQYCTHSDLQSGWPPRRDGWGLSGPNSTIQDYHARRYALLTVHGVSRVVDDEEPMVDGRSKFFSLLSKLPRAPNSSPMQRIATRMLPGGLETDISGFWSRD
ncbi:hypothetical protein E3N88_24256 [Mikania micrantha]|uniref:Uncharacterized protein n=1 Tax=Mikania micrantha TaxID=192012 RepID=A0A5N6NI44_9ASTR|nr:hypothetical protein E3N88_24256 [Mikania micrantha]